MTVRDCFRREAIRAWASRRDARLSIMNTEKQEIFCLVIKGRKGSRLAQKVFDLSNGEGGRTGFCDGENFGRSIVGPG